MAESHTLWTDVLAGGGTWSHVLKRGTVLRMTDTTGQANVGAYFLNAELPAERFNLPDTLKAQHTAKLARGTLSFPRLCHYSGEFGLYWNDRLGGCA